MIPRTALFLLAAASLVAAPKNASKTAPAAKLPAPETYKPSEGGALPAGLFKLT